MNGTVTTKELITIIIACRKNDVKNIKFGEVAIEFAQVNHPHENIITLCKDAKSSECEVDVNNLPLPLDDDFEETPFIESTDDDLNVQDELEFLAIENPAEFEELTIKALREERKGD